MIEIGKSFTQSITVTPAHTAQAMGSGKLEVFATPAMVALMENTAVRCLEGLLPEGSDTVGIAINVEHSRATAIGQPVTCRAEITEVDGRRIRFDIEASDPKGSIGHAVHDRFTINPEKFLSKL